MNPVLNYLITGGVIAFLVVFLAVVAYIAFRAISYRERNSGDFGGQRTPPPYQAPPPPPAPPPRQPPPRQPSPPPPRSSRSGRRRR
jgi:hypothetical protein